VFIKGSFVTLLDTGSSISKKSSVFLLVSFVSLPFLGLESKSSKSN